MLPMRLCIYCSSHDDFRMADPRSPLQHENKTVLTVCHRQTSVSAFISFRIGTKISFIWGDST